MRSIMLFDQDDVSVLLRDLHFDKEIDGVRAVLQIQNRKNISVQIVLADLWNGERFFDYFPPLCTVSPGKTEEKVFLELNSTYDEEDSIARFKRGYMPAFSFRLALYLGNEDADSWEFCSKGRKTVISKFSMDGAEVLPVETHRIGTDGEMLIASAQHHIPFEISKANPEKAQQIQSFKEELTVKIDSMEVVPWEVLVAKYGEIGKHRFYDIENMCIYNLGPSTFSRCCSTDIAFSELSEREMEELQKQVGATEEHKCFYKYAPVWREELENICNSKRLIADWNDIVIDASLPTAPHRYWSSIRRQSDRVCIHKTMDDPATDCFGIKVTVHVPGRLLPAGVMKPLLDGIVCAFHGRDGIDDVLRSITQDSFEKMVVDAENNIAVLGNKDYVQPYRNGFKWNPADDRLKFAWVSVVEENCKPYFEGKIFAWD